MKNTKPNYYTDPLYRSLIDRFKKGWKDMIYWNNQKDNPNRIQLMFSCYHQIEAIIEIMEYMTGSFRSLYIDMKKPTWDYLLKNTYGKIF